MATIPDFTALGQGQPQPSGGVASQSAAGAVGDAAAGLGETVAKIGEDETKHDDALALAAARAEHLRNTINLDAAVRNTPDYKTWKAQLSAGLDKSRADIGTKLISPAAREQFDLESLDDGLRLTGAIGQAADARARDAKRAGIEELLDGNLKSLDATSDPAISSALVASAAQAVDASVGAGIYSAQEGFALKQKFVQDRARNWAAAQSPADLARITGRALPALAGSTNGAGSTAPRAEDVAAGLTQAIPGLHVTGLGRTPEQNAAVGGVANSDHLADHAIDIRPVTGMTFDQFRAKAIAAGVPAGAQFIDETSPNAAHSTGPHWHIGWKPNAEVHSGEPGTVVKTGTPIDFLPAADIAALYHRSQAEAEIDGSIGRQQAAQTIDDQVAFLHTGGDPTKVTITPDGASVALGGGANGAHAADIVREAFAYNRAARALALATPETVNKILANAKPEGTADYAARSSDFNALVAVAQARQRELATDPADYALRADPVSGQAYTQANSSPDAFETYVSRLNGAYTQLGQPPDQRNILPVNDAKRTVSEIVGAKPQDAAQHLAALQSTTGRWWPKVFGELVKAGLPSTYQAVSVAAPHDQTIMIAALQRPTKELEIGLTLPRVEGKDDLDMAIDGDDGLASLKASFNAYGAKGLDIYAGTRAAVRQTALYLMNQGQTAGDAAAHAAAMVTGQFDFMPSDTGPPARLPKGLLDQATQATTAALASLSGKDVRPYAHQGDETGAAIADNPADLRDAALHGAKSAWWMTVPGHDGQPVLRAIDPQTNHPVILSHGGFLDVPLAAPVAAPAPPAPAGTTPFAQSAVPITIGGMRIPARTPRVRTSTRRH